MLENHGWAPAMYVTVVDHSNLPGYQVNTARFVEDRAIKRWLKGGVCYTRGLYTFGPTELEAGDPFGIYKLRIYFPQSESMMVIPPIVPLPRIEIATGDQVGEGGTRANAPEQTVTAASVREYVTGDNLHAIHWLTSARRDDLFVRVLDSTPTSDWWIFLDMDQNVNFGEDEHASEEYGVMLAASIAHRGLQNERAVGLVADGDQPVWLPPKPGNNQRWEILRSLAVIKPGKQSLSAMLAQFQRAMGRSTSLIVITPAVDGDWLDALVSLKRRAVSLTVLLLDREAFGNQGNPSKTLAKLSSLGVNHHLITPQMFAAPAVREDLLWRKSSLTRKASTFTISDLDWSNLK